MNDAPKRLRMFAGPNGSGKTSLIRLLARDFSATGLFHLQRYINADDLEFDLRAGHGLRFDSFGLNPAREVVHAALTAGGRLAADHPFLTTFQLTKTTLQAPPEACDGYVAAALADFLRDELLAAGQSLSFETVMSHASKVAYFARAQGLGYRTYLYFVCTESPILNVHRVGTRIVTGGHSVPEVKVVERYQRCLQLVGDALANAHRAFLFDNSGSKPVWIAQLTPDKKLELKVPSESTPHWFKTWIASRMNI